MQKLNDQDKIMILVFGSDWGMTMYCCLAGMDLGYVIGCLVVRQIDIWTYLLAALGTTCAYIWVRTNIAFARLQNGGTR